MKKAISLKEYKAKNITQKKESNDLCLFTCYNGVCSIDTSSTDVAGIQIEFSGKGNITPRVPDGWIFRGFNNKIIIINMNLAILSSGILFSYIGKVTLKSTLVSDTKGQIIPSSIRKESYQWAAQEWNWDDEGSKFVELKNYQTSYSKVTKTRFNMKADKGLIAKDGEFYLGEKPYVGAYHIPHDTNVPMTGAMFNKNSKPLSKTPIIKKGTKINTKKATKTQGGY